MYIYNIILFIVTLLIASTQATAKEYATYTLIDGTSQAGKLVAMTMGETIRFDTASGTIDIDWSSLLHWGKYENSQQTPRLCLTDGSILVAEPVEIVSKECVALSPLLGKLKVPRTDIVEIIFFEQETPVVNFDDSQSFPGEPSEGGTTTHSLTLLNGDRVQGKIESWNQERLVLETDVGPLSLETTSVASILFPTAAEGIATSRKPSKLPVVGLTDGSLLHVSKLSVNNESASFLFYSTTIRCESQQVIYLQWVDPRVTFVSDLPVISYRNIPFLSLSWPYRLDQNVLGSSLRCNGRAFQKGVGVHSACRLTYATPEKATLLIGKVGMDDRSQGEGSSRFRVFVDRGLGKWEESYTSPVVRSNQIPESFSVDVSDVKQISLLVEYADRADVRDYANWLDLRFVQ